MCLANSDERLKGMMTRGKYTNKNNKTNEEARVEWAQSAKIWHALHSIYRYILFLLQEKNTRLFHTTTDGTLTLNSWVQKQGFLIHDH